jgi:hypothetical protein
MDKAQVKECIRSSTKEWQRRNSLGSKGQSMAQKVNAKNPVDVV